jgi:hypothetical protein
VSAAAERNARTGDSRANADACLRPKLVLLAGKGGFEIADQ